MTHTPELAVEARNVTISWDRTTAVHDVTLDVRAGEVVALLGESGSGKTTMLRALAGLHPIAAGTLHVGGRLVDDPGSRAWVPPEQRRVGVVFQDYALFPNLTVARNIAYGAADRSQVDDLLSRVGLAGYGERPVTALSGGEQQRVAVARVLAQRPRVVLLDEPFSNLNRSLRHQLRDDTMAIIRATGAAAVLVTHDPEEALAAADRVAILRDGRVLQFDTPETVYHHPACVAAAEATGDAFVVPVDAHGQSPLGALDTIGDGPHAIVRPEQIVLATDGDGVDAVVRSCAFVGPAVQVHLAVDGAIYRAPCRQGMQAGAAVKIRVDGACQCVDANEHC
jgi:iron(III) transport system ATP-binding protein